MRLGSSGTDAPPSDGDEAGVSDHALFRPDASFGDVPRAMQHLERLEVLISPFVERHDELLDLSGGRDIRADDAAGRKGRFQRLQDSPRLGEIEDHPVEPLAGRSDVADVSSAKLEPR